MSIVYSLWTIWPFIFSSKMTKKENNKFSKIINWLYLKLFKINDTPHKIALGLGLGVFAGIFPGAGPAASLFFAFIFHANRASALIGSLLTNTWLSVVTFFLSIKLGSAILKLDWQDTYKDWLLFLKEFHWLKLFKLSILKLILPVIVGYLAAAFCIALAAYLITLIILNKRKKYEDKSRAYCSR